MELNNILELGLPPRSPYCFAKSPLDGSTSRCCNDSCFPYSFFYFQFSRHFQRYPAFSLRAMSGSENESTADQRAAAPDAFFQRQVKDGHPRPVAGRGRRAAQDAQRQHVAPRRRSALYDRQGGERCAQHWPRDTNSPVVISTWPSPARLCCFEAIDLNANFSSSKRCTDAYPTVSSMAAFTVSDGAVLEEERAEQQTSRENDKIHCSPKRSHRTTDSFHSSSHKANPNAFLSSFDLPLAIGTVRKPQSRYPFACSLTLDPTKVNHKLIGR